MNIMLVMGKTFGVFRFGGRGMVILLFLGVGNALQTVRLLKSQGRLCGLMLGPVFIQINFSSFYSTNFFFFRFCLFRGEREVKENKRVQCCQGWVLNFLHFLLFSEIRVVVFFGKTRFIWDGLCIFFVYPCLLFALLHMNNSRHGHDGHVGHTHTLTYVRDGPLLRSTTSRPNL